MRIEGEREHEGVATDDWTALVSAVATPVVDARQKPAAAGNPPTFTVDATWPQEFPNHWIMGSVTGVYVDSRDHVWITHLPETLTEEELYEEQQPPPAFV